MSLEPKAQATLETLKRVSVATLGGQLFKRGLRRQAVRTVSARTMRGDRLVGPAFTLRFVPLREDLVATASAPGNIHLRAVEECPAGAVLVADAAADLGGAVFGDILVARLQARGVAGMVIDGMIRDVGEIEKLRWPAFARGSTPPPSGATIVAADMNVPISCGGACVYPGDIMVGDGDGVIVVPAHMADEVAREGVEQEELELFIRNRISEGAPLDGLYPASPKTIDEFRKSRA